MSDGVRPKSQRGGVLVHFQPKSLSAVAYEVYQSLNFDELRVHPLSEARGISKTDVVVLNFPTFHADGDSLRTF